LARRQNTYDPDNAKFKINLQWQRDFLATVYSRFHSPLVPVDLHGTKSLVTSPQMFWQKIERCMMFDEDG